MPQCITQQNTENGETNKCTDLPDVIISNKRWLQRMGPSTAMYRAQIIIKHSHMDMCQMEAVENRHTIMYHPFV